MFTLFLAFSTFITICGKIYFKEEFSTDKWEEYWIYSKHPGKEWGKFILTHGIFHGDPEISKGIQTSEDARFYGLSTKFEPFTNEGKDLLLQFSVKMERIVECGGGYIKLFDCSLNPEDLHSETPYLIMFGPDICGYEKKKVQVIFNYKGKNLFIKREITCLDDDLTHLYTLVIRPDNTYVVKIDNEIEEGQLEKDWDFLLPKTIKDSNVTKPVDWVDDAKIEDPGDKKPEDWDQLEHIPDPNATKPVDWNDDIDGEWERPLIDNPAFKGEWKPRLIDNPKYKGPWVHPKIPNPEYVYNPNMYKYDEICGVGFDLWQVTSGTIFDNILITDSELEASKHAENTFEVIIQDEKAMKAEQERKEKVSDAEDEHDDKLTPKDNTKFIQENRGEL